VICRRVAGLTSYMVCVDMVNSDQPKAFTGSRRIILLKRR
jgi:hypothetical protein